MSKEQQPNEKPTKVGVLIGFKFGKGISKEINEGEWSKQYIEAEVKLPENATEKDFVANVTMTEYLIDQLLQPPQTPEAKEYKPATQQVKFTMTIEEFESQPWQASKWIRKDDGDRNAKQSEDAWMFADKADKRLIDMIKQAGDKLDFPPYTDVKFAGNNDSLIVRKGVHQKAK